MWLLDMPRSPGGQEAYSEVGRKEDREPKNHFVHKGTLAGAHQEVPLLEGKLPEGCAADCRCGLQHLEGAAVQSVEQLLN